MLLKYIIHIDSASGVSNNITKSAYAYYIKSNNQKINQQNSKIMVNKTKHQMILIGLINILTNIILYSCSPKSDIIIISTNSLYLVHPIFSNQIKEWSKHQFKNVKNGKLWWKLINITHLIKYLNFQWKKKIDFKTNQMLVKTFKDANRRYFKHGKFNYQNIINDVNNASLKAPKNPKYYKQWKLDTVPTYKFNSNRKHYKRVSTKYGMEWKKK